MPWFYIEDDVIGKSQQQEILQRVYQEVQERICKNPRRVLLLPPDITRAHSGAGKMTEMFYKLLPSSCHVDVIPTLGQHVPHTPEENNWMFGSIPNEIIGVHDWRSGCKTIGEVPADYVRKVSRGKADWPIPVSINSAVVDGQYDLIVNIGHVVPHEVLGFANHNKNYFIGLGGKPMICASHMMAACCGIENNLGNLVTPLRACFNKAEKDFLGDIPHVYIQIVMARETAGELVTRGIYVGDDLETYLMAAKKSRDENITVFDKPVKKIVAFMQADEFKSTWVANKAVYRTRMAIADGGELLIIAPGLERFGEQPEVDQIIRTYGYAGTPEVMKHYHNQPELQDLTHATAHLIHGSSEGRFEITYAPGHLTEDEIRRVKFNYVDIEQAIARYHPDTMKEGWNTMPDGEEIYFIKTPSAGLWACKDKMENREFDDMEIDD